MNSYEVKLSRFAEKQLSRLPKFILIAYYKWIRTVEMNGLLMARKISSYHDEPLNGKHKGQRSVRLNRSYRIIYEVHAIEKVIIIYIVEVNNHEYKVP